MVQIPPRSLRPRRLRAALSGGALALALLPAVPALADSLEAFATRLSTLRGDVESLSNELSSLTEDGRDELRSLARQKADLELELQKEETRLSRLGLAVTQKRQAIAADRDRDAELAPAFETNLTRVKAYVEASLPFRTEERLAELSKLESQLQSGLLTPPRAVSRLWGFVEDEFRLARENGLYQQTIAIDGQEQLADVVRIGTVMLFFKTRDDSVGYAARESDGYEYRLVTDPAGQKQILSLFDSFRKQIRAGYFQLPNAIAAKSGSEQEKPANEVPTHEEPANDGPAGSGAAAQGGDR